MPLLQTPRNHFDDDTARARALNAHAGKQAPSVLRDDIARAAWMMAIGAVDTYFCDAYADLSARTLQARQIQRDFKITDRMLNLKVPAIAVIRTSASDNWRWRMAAREVMENESVLSIDEVRSLFNQFCRKNHKPLAPDNFDAWIAHRDAKQRLFGISRTDYRKLSGKAKSKQRARSIERFEARYDMLFQRRHDCIHNCDRPKLAVNTANLSQGYVTKVIEDVVFFIDRFEDVIKEEFPEWLKSLNATATTGGRVLQ